MQILFLNNTSFHVSKELIRYLRNNKNDINAMHDLLKLLESGELCGFLNQCYKPYFTVSQKDFNVSFSNTVKIVVENVIDCLRDVENRALKSRRNYERNHYNEAHANAMYEISLIELNSSWL